MPALLIRLQANPRSKGYATNRGAGPTYAQETCLTVCTETRLPHNKLKPTGMVMYGERQELSQANSAVDTVRNDVGALEAVISCDARQCTRCEKCARAMASMRQHQHGQVQQT